MSEREAFIAGIAANPGDDTARLAFADFLDEHGEGPRAEFVRLQCSLARRFPEDEEFDWRRSPPAQGADGDRLSALLFAHWPGWFGPVLTALGMPAPGAAAQPKRAGAPWRFGPYVLDNPRLNHRWLPLTLKSDYDRARRGWVPPKQFVNALRLSRGFVTGLQLSLAYRPGECSLADALRLEPIESLTIQLDTDPDLWEPLSDPRLSRIRALDLSLAQHHDPGPDFAEVTERLLNDPYLSGVRRLTFTGEQDDYDDATVPLPVGAAEALVASAVARGVEALQTCLDAEGLRLFADAEPLPALRRLNLSAWPDAVSLGFSPYRDRLEELTLGGNEVDVAALSAGRPWVRLRSLDLRGVGPPAAVWTALARPGAFPELARLSIGHNAPFSPDGPAEAVRTGALPLLERLAVSGSFECSLVPLAAAVAPTAIRELDLSGVWDVTEDDYNRVRELLGDRVRISHPDDAIPF